MLRNAGCLLVLIWLVYVGLFLGFWGLVTYALLKYTGLVG